MLSLGTGTGYSMGTGFVERCFDVSGDGFSVIWNENPKSRMANAKTARITTKRMRTPTRSLFDGEGTVEGVDIMMLLYQLIDICMQFFCEPGLEAISTLKKGSEHNPLDHRGD